MEAVIKQKKELPKAGVNVSYSPDSIYRQYHKNVHNYIAFRINNHHDAEELTSDVFVKAMLDLKNYNDAFPMEAWLIGIAKNTVTDYLRRTMKRQFISLDGIVSLISRNKQPEDIVVINEEKRQLIKAMSMLRDKERQILSMKFATELKHSEIAEILKISESHVGVTAHRAVNKLKKLYEEDA